MAMSYMLYSSILYSMSLVVFPCDEVLRGRLHLRASQQKIPESAELLRTWMPSTCSAEWVRLADDMATVTKDFHTQIAYCFLLAKLFLLPPSCSVQNGEQVTCDRWRHWRSFKHYQSSQA